MSMADKVMIDTDTGAPAPAPTVAAVRRKILDDATLAPDRRRSVASLLGSAAKLLGTPAELLPFDAALLQRLAKAPPKRHRIGKGHLQNIRGAVRVALAHQGVAFVRGRDLSPPSAAWRALLDGLADDPEKSTLARAARWLTRHGIEPAAVTLADLHAFRDALVAGDVRGAAPATWGRLVNAWNRAAAAAAGVPGWPAVTIPFQRWPNRWTADLDGLPAGLAEGFRAFERWALGDDPLADDADLLADGGRARGRSGPRRAATIAGWRYMVRAYASSLLETGVDPDRLGSLEALVEPEVLRVGLRGLLARSRDGNRHRASSTAIMLKVLARDFLKLDRARVEAITDLCRRVRPEERDGLTAKNKERLAIFREKRRLRELARLPARLMDRALAAAEHDAGRKPALVAQTAVAIELFLMAPMRIGNLIRLRLDRHLSPLAVRDGQATIALPPEEMKNGRALDYLLDRDSCGLVQTYLARFRRRLAEPGNPFLFPGKVDGGHKHLAVLRDQVTKAMRDEMGAVWHPHLFRHLAAGLYLEEHPGEYETVRRLLGHARIETTVRYYAGAEMASSVRRYHEVLHGHRRPAAGGSRGR
jgi:integrase